MRGRRYLHQVHNAIEKGSVQAWELDGGMRKQHYERQYEPPPDYTGVTSIGIVVLSPEVGVAGHLAELLRLVSKDLGSVCFSKEEECCCLNQKIKDGCYPEDPSPVDLVDHVCAHDRCHGRTDEGEHAVDGLSLASFFLAPAVG